MDEFVQLAHDSVVRVFKDFGPELVLIHAAEFNGTFADIWSNYERVGEIEGEDVTVYQRRRPP